MENLTDKQLKQEEYLDIQKDFNLKIVFVTKKIKVHYPELT